jgi:hypothetical protein
MSWEYFLWGIGLLIGGYLLYRFRKWDYINIDSDQYRSIIKLRNFNSWLVTIMCELVGIVLIITSLPF